MHPWRERLHRWLEPLARRSPLSANGITFLALLLNLSAAVLLAFGGRWPLLFLAAAFVLTAAGFLDALDGIVARQRNEGSPFGDFFDHLADRISDIALIAGWLIGSSVRMTIALVTIALVALTGYAGTQLEASFGRRTYEGVGRGEFILGLFILPVASYLLVETELIDDRIGGVVTVAESLALLLSLFAAMSIAGRVRTAHDLRKGDE